MIAQRTLRQSVRATGVGLHSGEPVSLLLKPAPVNTGIRFIRTDLNPSVEIFAKASAVVHSPLCTALENNKDSARVATIEHLMAALCGLGIDNLIIEIDAAEVPIMDGSASPFVFLIQSAGIVEQSAPKSFISIQRKIRVQEGDKWAEFRPYAGFKMTFSIDFNHPAIRSRNQKMSAEVSSKYFTRELSRARTFGFLKDVEALRAQNLVKGGSVDNAVVLDDYRIINSDGLRFEDEFVRHKMLDAMGDIFLAGHKIIGHFVGHKSGHALNNRLVLKLLQTQSAWELITFDDSEKVPAWILDPAF